MRALHVVSIWTEVSSIVIYAASVSIEVILIVSLSLLLTECRVVQGNLQTSRQTCLVSALLTTSLLRG